MSELNIGEYRITQLGYVYKDIKKQVNLLETRLGMPKFAYMENKFRGTYKYRGKDTKFWSLIAISRGIGIQIELNQLIEGECHFKEFLDAGNEGLHHYAIFLEDLNSVKKKFLDKGFEIVIEGTTGTVNVCYFDMVDLLGVYLELQESITKKKK